MSHNNSYRLPSSTGLNYNQSAVTNYLSRIQAENSNIGFGAAQYLHGATAVSNAYAGAVYSPTQQRIYFVPYSQLAQATWHYYDCPTGKIVPYTPGTSDTSGNYYGGAYSPLEDKIYFSPYSQSSGHSFWHFLNCKAGAIGTYTPPSINIAATAYWGAVYTPTRNRVFYLPFYQSSLTALHYVSCDGSMTVSEYPGINLGSLAYWGGCYAPTLDRIYLAPCNVTGGSWHYISCGNSTPSMTSYTAGSGLASAGYAGAVYSPMQDRVYFIPALQSQQPTWHYVDCKTGSVIGYAHGATVPSGSYYVSGSYSPITNRIYMAPNGTAMSTWHYIDCDTGSIVAYSPGVSVLGGGYYGSTFCPVQNRVVFTPFAQATQTTWHYIQEYSNTKVSPALMVGPAFNKL